MPLDLAPGKAKQEMDESDLVSLLKQHEADASSYHSSDLAKAQEEALQYFNGKIPNDVEPAPGRSTVVSRDIEDTIHWIMPDLMRSFMSSDDVVTIEAGSPEDEQADPGDKAGRSKVELAAEYINHVFYKDNRGIVTLYDFAFDGLLLRQGVMSIRWKDPEPEPPKILEGITIELLDKYIQDPEYKILAVDPMFEDEAQETEQHEAAEPAQLEQSEEGAEGGQPTPEAPVDPNRMPTSFRIQVQKTPRMGRVHIEAVLPEEFAVAKQSTSLETASYHRRKRQIYLADAIRLNPEKKYELENFGAGAADQGSVFDSPINDPRALARLDREGMTLEDSFNPLSARKVTLVEEYIRCDYDGDGIVELRHVKRIGNTVLENIAVDRSEFRIWSPLRVSHRIAGRSLADVLGDIMRIRTKLTRLLLDGLGQSLTPQKVANETIDDEEFNRLLDNEIGQVIRARGPAGDAVSIIATPDVSPSAYQGLEYFEQRVEQASGVTRHSQGMDPGALNKTATGIDLLQAAAKTRIEMIARWLGLALEEAFQDILRLVCEHQDAARMIKVKGSWVEMDPRRWSDEMAVRVHVGQSGSSRQQQLVHLGVVAQKQEQIMLHAGPSNPLVTMKHLRNTYARMCEAAGFKDPSAFFAEISDEQARPPQQAQQPDPKMIETQAKIQMDQVKLQSDQQMKTAELQHKVQMAATDAQLQREIAETKARSEYEIAQLRIAAETEIANRRLEAEMELARQRAAMEMELARDKHEHDKELAKSKADSIGGGLRMGGEIG